jgi:carboxypeptidase Taq
MKYLALEKYIESVFELNNVVNILYADSMTITPINSQDSRVLEIKNISAIAHKLLTSIELSDLISEAQTEIDILDDWQKANLREITRRHVHASSINSGLQRELMLAKTNCELMWKKAKDDNSFSMFKPYLQRVLSLSQEVAHIKSEQFNKPKYDTFLDVYNADQSGANIRDLYSGLKTTLPTLIPQIIDKQRSEKVLSITEISLEVQKAIIFNIMTKMGFDFMAGRIDEAPHPFCGGTPHDVRLLVKYGGNFIKNIMSAIHETGHGLYEQGLPNKYRNQPVGKARSMAFHESQALIMEMQIARSQEFMEFLARMLKDEFGLVGNEYNASNLYKLSTRVNSNAIRIGSDEITYHMHVLLRVEIEEALLENTLTLEELPYAWNDRMKEYLGIIPATEREGCLQDVHWSKGYFGYFPSYTTGAITASMLMQKIKAKSPNITTDLASGNLSTINIFLNEHVRSKGSLCDSQTLMKSATGLQNIDPRMFIQYINHKYL